MNPCSGFGNSAVAIERRFAELRWLQLTHTTLPALAATRGWPISVDHCLQRILLDAACGGCWYDHIAGRPACRHADPAILERAIALGRAVAGIVDLAELNRRSLAWRRAGRLDPATASR